MKVEAKERPEIFVLEVSQRSRTVVEDPILGLSVSPTSLDPCPTL